jgi:hypothetical protein
LDKVNVSHQGPTFRNVLHSPISLCIIKLIKHKLKVMHSKVSFFVFEKVLCFTLGRLATTGLPHQIRASPPRSGVSLPLSGNQFKVFFSFVFESTFPTWAIHSSVEGPCP